MSAVCRNSLSQFSNTADAKAPLRRYPTNPSGPRSAVLRLPARPAHRRDGENKERREGHASPLSRRNALAGPCAAPARALTADKFAEPVVGLVFVEKSELGTSTNLGWWLGTEA